MLALIRSSICSSLVRTWRSLYAFQSSMSFLISSQSDLSVDQIKDWVKAGIKVYSCYEAGFCGYWYHQELIKAVAVNFVVVPRALENQRTRHQKTDRLDARALLDRLESYLNGNRHAMSVVTVPSLEEEQQRSVVRYREQLMRDRRRAEARGKAVALANTRLIASPDF
jgi:transposase